MKRRLSKLVAFFLLLCMAVPMFAGLADCLSAQAASVSLNATSRKVYLGTTFQLKVTNADMDKVKSVTWKSNRSSIAKVDSNGVVTPVKVGTTTVKCTLKYKDGSSSKPLACTIIVRNRVEAKTVKFTNVTLDEDNAKRMYVGSTFTVKKSVSPSNTTDSVFYTSEDEGVATISTSGVITAKKPGITVIEVRYGLSKSDAVRADNKAVAKFYLHVVKKPAPTPTPTATPTPSPTPTPLPVLPKVEQAKMVGSQELQITFNQPVRKSSVLNGNKLVAGVIVVGRDEKASDFGVLTADFSADAKTLTIHGTGSFNGIYSVVVSGKVMSAMGQPFEQYSNIMTLKDTTGPIYLNTTVGYNGLISNINFNEALDITNMTVESVSGTTDALLSSYLKEVSNYRLSDDKRTLSIDLSGYVMEKNLTVTVMLKGIRDTAGNTTSRQLQSVYVRTDTSAKPLASIVKAERISKTEIELTFSAELSSGGMAQFGSYTSYGVVDMENQRLVRYEIPAAYQSVTGYQTIGFSGWYNYNAITSTVPSQSYPVNFTLDATPPQLLAYELTNAVVDGRTVSKLILTYNKEIRVATTTQQVSVRVRSGNGDISTVSPFSTTAEVENTIVTYIFEEPAMLGSGQFTFMLPEGMVADKLENYSRAANVVINKNGTASTDEAPMPISAVQSTEDLSLVYLNFSGKIDPDTGEQVQNYYLVNGMSRIYPIGASVSQNNDSSVVVELTFNTGAFTSSYGSSYELVVNGVRGFGTLSGVITNQSIVFSAVENEPPKPVGNTFNNSMITINMSEDVVGTIRISAVDTTTGASFTGYGTASGKQIFITLDGLPTSRTIRFTVTDNQIFDMNGNRANFVSGQYVATQSVY